MPFANGANGVRIYFRVVGDEGPFVILLHGLGLSGRFWFSVPELLTSHADTPCRVIVVDNRGTGRSDCPGRPWMMAHMAEDALAVVRVTGQTSLA